MPKTIHVERCDQTFFLPANAVRAVAHAVSTEETRFYLKGVYVETCEHTNATILTATDGHVLLNHQLGDNAFGAPCPTKSRQPGFLLETDWKDKAWKSKSLGELWVYGDFRTGLLQFVDTYNADNLVRVGVCEFEAIDGTFPDYRRVLPDFGAPAGASACVNADLVATMASAHKTLLGTRNSLMSITAASESAPMAVRFKNCEMRGVIMPVRM